MRISWPTKQNSWGHGTSPLY